MSVSLPVLYGLCMCAIQSVSALCVWFSAVQPRLNGFSVCASFLTPAAALHLLSRSKCCTPCAKITGALTQRLNFCCVPEQPAALWWERRRLQTGGSCSILNTKKIHRLIRQSVQLVVRRVEANFCNLAKTEAVWLTTRTTSLIVICFNFDHTCEGFLKYNTKEHCSNCYILNCMTLKLKSLPTLPKNKAFSHLP